MFSIDSTVGGREGLFTHDGWHAQCFASLEVSGINYSFPLVSPRVSASASLICILGTVCIPLLCQNE